MKYKNYTLFVESIMHFDKLYRLFLSHVKRWLSQSDIRDITPAQAMILFHLEQKTIKMTDILSNDFYFASNPAYNIKKMVENGYIHTGQSKEDRRLLLLSLTKKGEILHGKLEVFFNLHIAKLEKSGMTLSHFQEQKTYMEQIEHLLLMSPSITLRSHVQNSSYRQKECDMGSS